VRHQVDQLRLFVAELPEVREARGVTKASLARMTGLCSNTISDLEAGRTYPDWSAVARIAWALDADTRFVGRPSDRPDGADPR
jgi:DNA-binding XRE family transcriptional regulator